MEHKFTAQFLSDLRRGIVETFSIDDLKSLCADLGVEYENLGGGGKESNIRELISYFKRHGTLSQLVDAVKLARPNHSWPQEGASGPSSPPAGNEKPLPHFEPQQSSGEEGESKAGQAVLEFYHYLDEEGLDSLYAQAGDFFVEKLTELEKAGKIDGDAEVEIGPLLKLIGAGGFSVSGNISLNGMKSESFKSVFKVEQRIPLILSYLRAAGSLQEYPDGNFINVREGYIYATGQFMPPDIQEVLDKSRPTPAQIQLALLAGDKELLKTQGFVKFVANTLEGPITMGTSLGKYKTGLQHLLIMWQGAGGVWLRVFGYISKTKPSGFYIKPFTVAQAQ